MDLIKRSSLIIKNIVSKDVRTVYYLVLFLRNLGMGFISATYALFLLSNGLSALQMNLVNTAFMIGNFIFEIPTGVYADFFGRKKSYIVHAALLSLSAFVYFSSKSFPFFVLAELLAALSFTFASGAIDAWLVDNVGEDWVTRTDYVFSQGEIYSKLALIIGGIAGGYFGSINLAFPWLLLGITALLIVFISKKYMKNDQPKRVSIGIKKGMDQMANIAKDSIQYGLKHKVVLWLMISTFLSQLAFQPLNMFWAPRFNQMVGDQVGLMGWMWAAMSGMMLFGSYFARKFIEKKTKYWQIMTTAALILGLPILLSSISSVFIFAAGGFLIYEFGRGIDKPIKMSYLNKYFPSDKRATLISFDSMMGKIAAALGLIFFGFLADKTNFSASWFVSGLMLLLLIPLYFQVRKKEREIII